MSIFGAVIVPHPPLIIPTVGRGREQEVQTTIDAYFILSLVNFVGAIAVYCPYSAKGGLYYADT